ncbi:MAG: bifunctional methylenetetrahydrofolate dehydrogenase/methenyltetrahydrofolate cyclohydrolase FolD [Mariprofundaceae bacterium]|nr:bifunctional methylenetetrahydrofolate dehydrogenase/methenyltetrahydrofolate cyclohydrolase FolD [Mariprofundaceae bacterium]
MNPATILPTMTATILDGKTLSQRLRQHMCDDVDHISPQYGRLPGLAVILVGDDPASEIYVNSKKKACEAVGIHSFSHEHDDQISQQDLLALIESLNQDDRVDGILVQLPLPKHIDSETILESILPHKDVDGFHPYNIGRLAVRLPGLRSCTPYGCMKLLEETGVDLHGKHAVIVGASNIVGRPMSLELLLAGATTTVCHRFTKNLEAHIRQADIVVAAAGKQGLIDGEWIKEGAIVLDVGIHRQSNGKLCGDVDFEKASQRAGWISPVPGGVGPMTITMLLHNTITAYKQHLGD